MRLIIRVLAFALASLPLVNDAYARDAACLAFDGAIIVDSEGNYLGKVASRYDSDSIFNKYGTYGSKYNSESIWNKYGEFGNPYGLNTWSNKFATDPPMIVRNRQVIGILTVNRSVAGAVSPILLGVMCFDYEPD